MNGFISFAEQFHSFLTTIVCSNDLHARWINTLSFLENSGARKIASCEHPTMVKEEMLKHAAEEFRHAHYLKKQIPRVSAESMTTYSLSYILGGLFSMQYLRLLDLKTSRYLKAAGFQSSVKEAAYLLVTYAIERRASELYPIYEGILRKSGSRVTVKSILLEEEDHLKEMEEGLRHLPSGFIHAEKICAIESSLCKNWVNALLKETNQ